MKHGSLFSGIGGFDLAAEWMGWENVFHCEWNEFGQKILKHYWPNAISYTDITKTDFTIHRGTIDILTGGFPCQPYSAAGKRLGTEDNRHLWPQMLRAVREIQPGYVVGENVRGLTNWNGGLVFDQVQADLEAEGYEVLPFLLPACAVDAPHRRDRIWFVAYSNNTGTKFGMRPNGYWQTENENGERFTQLEFGEVCIVTPNPKHRWPARETTKREGGEYKQQGNEIRSEPTTSSEGWTFTDTPAQRFPISGLTSGIISVQSENGTQFGDSWITTNTNDGRFPLEEHWKEKSGWASETGIPNDWRNFPTQSPVCSRNDGVSARLDGITFPKWRNESIKGYGNAIVPQVAYQIFKAIELT